MNLILFLAILAALALAWVVVAEMRYPHGRWQAYLERRRQWAALALFLERHGEALFFPLGRDEATR